MIETFIALCVLSAFWIDFTILVISCAVSAYSEFKTYKMNSEEYKMRNGNFQL